MTARDFAYWLQGFFELNESISITEKQTETIKNHLNLVFYHEIDPSYSKDPEVQKKMNEIHTGKKKEESKPTSSVKHNYHTDPQNVILRC